MQSMVLAAGFGTRLRPHTNIYAKPALPFLNIPMLAYSTSYLVKNNIQKICFNSHHLPQTIEQAVHFTQSTQEFESVIFNESPNILGSAGGILNAHSELSLSDNFIVLNGDSVFLLPHFSTIKNFLDFHRENKNLATFMTIDDLRAGKDFRALWTDENHEIKDISKGQIFKELHPEHFIGIMAFSNEIFNLIPKTKDPHIFDDVLIPKLKESKRIKSFKINQLITHETGNPKDYLKASRLFLKRAFHGTESVDHDLRDILKNFYPSFKLQDKSKGYVPSSSLVKCSLEKVDNLFVGNNSYIAKDVTLSGDIIIGDNCKIESDSALTNCVIGHNLSSQFKLENEITFTC